MLCVSLVPAFTYLITCVFLSTVCAQPSTSLGDPADSESTSLGPSSLTNISCLDSTNPTPQISSAEAESTATSKSTHPEPTGEEQFLDKDITTLDPYVQNSSKTGNSPNAVLAARRAWFSRQTRWGINFMYYWNIFISPIGILGNVMCILVVSQKHNRSVSCSIYMGALAVADTLMLIANVGQMLVLFHLQFVPFPTFKSLCKLDYYMQFTAAHCGVMIILAMLAERVIVVTKPLQAARLLSPQRAVYIIIGICIFCCIFNIPRALVTSATFPNGGRDPRCGIMATNLAVGYNFSSFVVTGVIPLFAIFIMNAVILYGVKTASKKITKHTKHESSSESISTSTTVRTSVPANTDEEPSESTKTEIESEKDQPITSISKASTTMHYAKAQQARVADFRQRAKDRRERQLTLMTIVMTTVFLVCSVPRYAHLMTFAVIQQRGTLRFSLVYLWSGTTTVSLFALNSAINFYLYVVTGSKFRADAIKLVTCKRG